MSIKLKGSTDGSVTLQAPADTSPTGSDITLTLPTTTGSANQFVKNGGTAGELEFSSMVEDSSGRLLIGTTSPGPTSAEQLTIEDSANCGITIRSGTTAGGAILFEDDTADRGEIQYSHNGDYMRFKTAGTERMRITSGGNIAACGANGSVLVGAGNTSTGFVVESAGSGTEGALFISRAATQVLYLNRNNNGSIAGFSRSGTGVGSIAVTTSSTSYNTSSDHRLKENVVDLSGAITRVKQLAPKRFNFIADAETTVDGFLAHEAQTVVPEAVTGTHNEVDDDGNPVYQGIDQSKLVPLLTAALQEAIAKIETLETQNTAQQAQIDDLLARVTALEAA